MTGLRSLFTFSVASYFIQHVFLKFGMCYVVVLDDGTPFKRAFTAMCGALNYNHDVLAKRNYKFLTIEYYFYFLNKSVTIVAQERDTNDILFLLASPLITLGIVR